MAFLSLKVFAFCRQFTLALRINKSKTFEIDSHFEQIHWFLIEMTGMYNGISFEPNLTSNIQLIVQLKFSHYKYWQLLAHFHQSADCKLIFVFVCLFGVWVRRKVLFLSCHIYIRNIIVWWALCARTKINQLKFYKLFVSQNIFRDFIQSLKIENQIIQ